MTSGGFSRVGPFVAVAGLLALLAGCGRFGVAQREPWRAEAEMQCLRSGAVQASWAIERGSAISGPGVCGMDHPLRVTAFAKGSIMLKQRNTLGCPMVAEVDRWLSAVVQPAAQAVYGGQVVEIRSGSYSCRSRNSQRGARISEHAFGNALDVFAFRFADGREVAVKSGWRGPADEQAFLRQVFAGACEQFTTVLGPGADAFHYDHLHLDLARHDPRGLRRVCKPILREPALPGEGRIDRATMSYRPPANADTAAAGAAPVLPRAPIPGARPFPTQLPPQTAQAQPGVRPVSPPPVARAGAPLDLSGPLPGRPAPADSEEIDPDNDPFAVDD